MSSKEEQAVRECCRTLAGDFKENGDAGECQFRDALLAVLDAELDEGDEAMAAYRSNFISDAHKALFGED